MSDLHTATLIADADLADDVELPARKAATAGLLKITLAKFKLYITTALASKLVPAGGTGGQVLKKIDGTDYNVGWGADNVGSGGATTLDGLTDVDTSTTPPTDGQALIFNNASGLWKPGSVAGGGGSSTHPSLTAHRYWIIHFAGSKDFAASVAEIEMRATPGGADQTTGGTAIASASGAGAAANAFDNNAATFWADNSVSSSGKFFIDTWIGYDFGAGNSKVVQEIAISARNDTSPDQTPTWGLVMYSDDGVTYYSAFEFNFATTFTLGQTRTSANPWIGVPLGGSGSGPTLINSQTVSGAASVVFDNTMITATYKTYEIRFQGVTPSASATFIVQVSPDNGTTWRTTGYISARNVWGISTNFANYAQALVTNGLLLIGDSNTDAARTQNGNALLYNLLSATQCDAIQANHIGKSSDGNVYDFRNSGMYTTAAEAHNAIRIVPSSGATTFSGTFELYGTN